LVVAFLSYFVSVVFTWCALIAIAVHVCGWGKSWVWTPQTVKKSIAMLDFRKIRESNLESFNKNSSEMPIDNEAISQHDLRASNKSILNVENFQEGLIFDADDEQNIHNGNDICPHHSGSFHIPLRSRTSEEY
jgi:hypothetical protein